MRLRVRIHETLRFVVLAFRGMLLRHTLRDLLTKPKIVSVAESPGDQANTHPIRGEQGGGG